MFMTNFPTFIRNLDQRFFINISQNNITSFHVECGFRYSSSCAISDKQSYRHSKCDDTISLHVLSLSSTGSFPINFATKGVSTTVGGNLTGLNALCAVYAIAAVPN